MFGFARKKGISFISIDETRPLSEQGPFDIILHKVSQILEYVFQVCGHIGLRTKIALPFFPSGWVYEPFDT